MYNKEIIIGRIIKVESLSIVVEVIENDVVDTITINMYTSDFLVSINSLIYSLLPNGKKAIAKVTKIQDKSFSNTDILIQSKAKYLFEAKLVGIYDDSTGKFDNGINSFPIIGSEVYSLTTDMYKRVYNVDSKYALEIGQSYHNQEICLYANSDVLLGKHLGIFGNTGTGKTCTIVSIIQGLKRRLKSYKEDLIDIKPKIVIFDANNEYENAFPKDEYKVRIIRKEELRLPHYYLSYTEYYKFVDASQGVQAPTLKAAIKKLKEDNDSEVKFRFKDLPNGINSYINEITKKDPNKKNQWINWNSTMINRIERIIEDDRLISIIDSETEKDTIDDIIQSDDEIIIIEADFDKDEIDIIMFLFCKLIYHKVIENYRKHQEKSILLLFEEAHRYINESDNQDYKLGNYYIERLAREGRKFGISLIISSQRPSELSPTVLSQCNSFIIHRITNRNDLDFISKVLRTNNQELIYLISGLEKQYAVVVGEAFGYSDIVRIYDACPTPMSKDPEVIDSWKEKDINIYEQLDEELDSYEEVASSQATD